MLTRFRTAVSVVLVVAIALGVWAAPLPTLDRLPKKGLSTHKNATFRAAVLEKSRKLLGDKVGFWNKMTTVKPTPVLKSNPPVKYPHIPISCGNSYMGVFDTARAKKAAKAIFAEWGIDLKDNVIVEGKGYTFEADGYNAKLGIGFEIVMPEGRVGLGPQKFEPEPAAKKLDKTERQALDKAIADGKQRIFLVDATGFPNMDGDQHTALEYYLASVIDYLNHVHGDKTFSKTDVLGNEKGTYAKYLEDLEKQRALRKIQIQEENPPKE